MIRFLDYCSGIGAFRQGLQNAGGFECVGYCECDPTAVAAYRALYDTKNEVYFNDARILNPQDIPPFDMLVGGIPCQSWSQAGRRKGFDDERGQLFYDFARILEERQPPLFIIENVPALTTADSCRAYHTILGKIHELGYDAEWQIIDGTAYLPHKRKRLFLVGFLDRRLSCKIFPITETDTAPLKQIFGGSSQGTRVYDVSGASCTITAQGGEGGSKTGMYFIDMNSEPKITDEARCITSRQDSGISKHKGEHSGVLIEDDGTYPILSPDREKVRQQGRRIRENGAPAFCITVSDRHGVVHKGRVRRLMPQECWLLMGFTDKQFETVSSLGFGDGKLYKLAGNSIMVPVVTAVGLRIKVACEEIGLFIGN
jgi:DNA (cytosine-5)-methyltransferase 1